MDDWLGEFRRPATEREGADGETLRATSEWVRCEVVPAMRRFAADLRTIGRQVQVTATETRGRVEVRDGRGLVPEFTAEIGTDGPASVAVRDRLPATPAVFQGADRLEVTSEQVYEALKLSYLARLRSGPA